MYPYVETISLILICQQSDVVHLQCVLDSEMGFWTPLVKLFSEYVKMCMRYLLSSKGGGSCS